MLADVGLKVDIVSVDLPTYLRRRQGTPEEAGNLAQGRWSCACQDADGVIWPLFHTRQHLVEVLECGFRCGRGCGAHDAG